MSHRTILTKEGVQTIDTSDEDFEDNDVLDEDEDENEFDENKEEEEYYEEENPFTGTEEMFSDEGDEDEE